MTLKIKMARTLFSELTSHYRDRILSGEIAPGNRLPSLRELKAQWQVSHATALRALIELERLGMIESRPRSGFYALRPIDCQILSQSDAEIDLPRPPSLSLELLGDYQRSKLEPFGLAGLHNSLLPIHKFSKILRELSKDLDDKVLTYPTPPGSLSLRRRISNLASTHGFQVNPYNTLINYGAMDGISLALRMLADRGDSIAVESPTSMNTLALLKAMRLQVLELPTDPIFGLHPSTLANAVRKRNIKACILTPNFSNPVGSLMPDDARKEIVRILGRAEIPLIEDDVYGALSFDGSLPRPLKGYDSKGLVIYCSSFSKTLSPSLRLGWMEAGRFKDRLMELQFASYVGCNPINQLLQERYLESGHYVRHLRSLRGKLKQNLEDLRDGVMRLFPQGTKISNPNGGFLLWLQLPNQFDGTTLFRLAQKKNVGIVPGELFSNDGSYKNFVRLSAGGPADVNSEKALRILGSLLQKGR